MKLLKLQKPKGYHPQFLIKQITDDSCMYKVFWIDEDYLDVHVSAKWRSQDKMQDNYNYINKPESTYTI